MVFKVILEGRVGLLFLAALHPEAPEPGVAARRSSPWRAKAFPV
jgi:hypothetical protein